MRRLSIFLCAAVLASCATPPRPTAPSATPKVPAPMQTPPTRSANALTPIGSVPRTIVEPKIRVGLLTDQSAVTFPRTAEGYFVVSDAGASTLKRGFTLTPPLAKATTRYAIQVSAISDQRSAEALIEKIQTEMKLPVRDVFDPAAGAYRILAGDFPDADSATPLRAQLTDRGYGKDMLVVRRPSDEKFELRHQLVDDEGDAQTIAGESLLILPITGDTIVLDKLPYRSAARVFINNRGMYNVINELNLEEYLYGVVPAEMGPTIYDEVEGLKAQAVAARTYAVRNLGQFRNEGYDICPGPACQAYKGFSGEHELSTRAVRETAGLVATYQGRMIDALYSATCGGETSDVSTMFPERNEPYLKAAKCVELDIVTIDGRADSGLLTEMQLQARMFAALADQPTTSASWSAADVERAVVAAFGIAGATPPTAPKAASSRRGDVLRYLAAMMRLAEKGRVLTLPEDRRYWFAQTANPDDDPHAAAAFLVKFGINPAQFIDRVDLSQAMPREELYALLGAWIAEQKVVQNADGKIYRVEGRKVTLKSEGKLSSHTLPAGIPIFRRLGDRVQEYKTVPVLLGDRATVLLNPQKVPVGLIVNANYDGASFDRTSSFANWTRSWRADELVPVINRRNPIQQLLDIRPVTTDASQRVIELEVTAEGGRKFMLRGLPVRWSLNVPDNLFVYDKSKDSDGVDRYTFYGKGWGHGTGMCQVGAYGMAFRGWTFDRILKNFYTGIEIVPMAQAQK
jgi:stage II sporulation protein D